jgi:hypothetical protein
MFNFYRVLVAMVVACSAPVARERGEGDLIAGKIKGLSNLGVTIRQLEVPLLRYSKKYHLRLTIDLPDKRISMPPKALLPTTKLYRCNRMRNALGKSACDRGTFTIRSLRRQYAVVFLQYRNLRAAYSLYNPKWVMADGGDNQTERSKRWAKKVLTAMGGVPAWIGENYFGSDSDWLETANILQAETQANHKMINGVIDDLQLMANISQKDWDLQHSVLNETTDVIQRLYDAFINESQASQINNVNN